MTTWRTLSCALTSAILLATACGAPAKPVAQPVLPATPAEVVTAGKSIAEQYSQGWAVRSLDALAPLYVQGLDLVVVHQGTTLRGWTSVETYLTDFFTRATKIETKLTDVTVVAFAPDGALVTASFKRIHGDGVTSFTERGTLYLILTRLDGTWRILAEHYSYSQ